MTYLWLISKEMGFKTEIEIASAYTGYPCNVAGNKQSLVVSQGTGRAARFGDNNAVNLKLYSNPESTFDETPLEALQLLLQ